VSSPISPLWWPVVAALSPVLVPTLAVRHRTFRRERDRARDENRRRIDGAAPLELPSLDALALTVLVEERCQPGFLGDAGVSYLLRSEQGTLLFDVGFGPERPALGHNARRLDVSLDQVDALAISHLHLDHMGGARAMRRGQVAVPDELGSPTGQPCFLPAPATAPGFRAEVITGPRRLAAGLGTTGPLARGLFLLGFTEEQALVARIAGQGLVLITGCGHPTVAVLLEMLRALSSEPLYALVGGLHFPLTDGRGNRAGIQLQRLIGTGKPPWAPPTDADLDGAIEAIRAAQPRRLLLSAHDTCDHALERLGREVPAEVEVLEAGATYTL